MQLENSTSNSPSALIKDTAAVAIEHVSDVNLAAQEISPSTFWNPADSHPYDRFSDEVPGRRLDDGHSRHPRLLPHEEAKRDIAAESEWPDFSPENEYGESLYRSLIDILDIGIVVLDSRGRPVGSNTPAERILGVRLDQMAKFKALGTDGAPFSRRNNPAVRALRTGESQRAVVIGFPKDDGSVTWTLTDARPLVAPKSGHVIGIVESYTDITDIYIAEQLIKHRLDLEELMHHVLESVRTETDPDTIQERVSTLIGKALKFDRCYYSTYDHDLDIMQRGKDWHRDDLKSVAGTCKTSRFYMDSPTKFTATPGSRCDRGHIRSGRYARGGRVVGQDGAQVQHRCPILQGRQICVGIDRWRGPAKGVDSRRSIGDDAGRRTDTVCRGDRPAWPPRT